VLDCLQQQPLRIQSNNGPASASLGHANVGSTTTTKARNTGLIRDMVNTTPEKRVLIERGTIDDRYLFGFSILKLGSISNQNQAWI
jgi:hypothetical protein